MIFEKENKTWQRERERELTTAWERVWAAVLSDKSGLLPVGNSAAWVATIAGASTTAAVHVFSRETSNLALVNAEPVRHKLNSAESPARATCERKRNVN